MKLPVKIAWEREWGEHFQDPDGHHVPMEEILAVLNAPISSTISPEIGTISPKTGTIYTEHTTRMAMAQTKFEWAMRDRKILEARKHLADIKECVAALDNYLNPEDTVPPKGRGLLALRRLLGRA